MCTRQPSARRRATAATPSSVPTTITLSPDWKPEGRRRRRRHLALPHDGDHGRPGAGADLRVAQGAAGVRRTRAQHDAARSRCPRPARAAGPAARRRAAHRAARPAWRPRRAAGAARHGRRPGRAGRRGPARGRRSPATPRRRAARRDRQVVPQPDPGQPGLLDVHVASFPLSSTVVGGRPPARPLVRSSARRPLARRVEQPVRPQTSTPRPAGCGVPHPAHATGARRAPARRVDGVADRTHPTGGDRWIGVTLRTNDRGAPPG